MGKKKGAKKSGGDDFWDEGGEKVPTPTGVADSGDEGTAPVRKSAFAAMSLQDGGDDNDDDKGPVAPPLKEDDDDDFGGLMGALKKSGKKGAKGGKKGKKQKDDDDIWDQLGEDVSGNADPKRTEEMDVEGAEAVVDANSSKANGTKEVRQASSPSPSAAGPGQEDAEGEADNPHRVLTKKEKEKLKKEREKAKKKAEADAKKASAAAAQAEEDDGGGTGEVQPPVEEKESAPAVAVGEEDGSDGEGGGGDGAGAADKKKKKKKKKAAETKEAAPTTKKPSAALQALQARLAAQKKAEEEARAAEEEARRREEEAERLEKEEEERKEAERQRRKEKEKAKREQLKKEGKLLTPKQKAEKAAAEARMQALIKAGNVKIDGLTNRQNGQGGEEKEKRKVVYDSRKKKKGSTGPPSKLDASLPPPEPIVAEAEVEQSEKTEAQSAVVEVKEAESDAVEPEKMVVEEDVKKELDAESDADVKDDWDAESEEEDAEVTKREASAAASAANGKSDSIDEKSLVKRAADSESSEEDDDSDDDSDEDSEDEKTVAQQMAAKRKAEAEQRRKEKHEAALAATSKDNLRSPICCIMGHVDTGKTSLLDKVRQTNVQEGEAGGITQQIGATYFPVDVLKQKIAPIDPEGKQVFNTPGLLIIDTPGHEAFTNLRTRGSSLCNIAILVVDIMHGLEQQTLESIRLLRDRKTPFIVALNKVDRLYGWQSTPDGAFRDSLAKQNRSVQNEFYDRYQKTCVAFAEQGLNAVLYYENKNFAKNVSLVPTSAHTGEGIPDMIQLLINLTQDRMSEKLMYLSELECTVLEVKVIEGLGTTIDVILSNGVMYEGDKIVLCGLNGPIVTQVRALLTPQPLKEMRVKGSYVHHKMVKAALGVKIAAPDLEKAISGSRLVVCGPDDDEEELKEEIMSDLTGLLHSIDKSGKGVCVQASTLGSLEALLQFLKQSKIPVNGINIGPVYKRDVMRCATMLEKNPDLAVMLCFDVIVDKEAEKLAEELGVKIFCAPIIYHLFDSFVAHQKQVLERKQKENTNVAVWPCRLKILAVFAKRAPIILGCEVLQGDLRLDTPIAVKSKTGELIDLGRVTSLEVNHKRMDVVNAKTAHAGVAVKIEPASHDNAKSYGRHFTEEDELFSHISRQSIDALKEFFWDSMSTEQKKCIKTLKGVIGIP